MRKNEGQWEFLLLRCFKYWDFPKGECNSGEDPLKSALRELQEETTLTSIEMNWGEVFYETEPYSKGKTARYYIGQVSGNETIALLPNPETGIVEHHEYRWVTYAEAMKLANPRIQKVIDWCMKIIS